MPEPSRFGLDSGAIADVDALGVRANRRRSTLELAGWACLIDGRRKVLSKYLQRFIGRDTKVCRNLLDLLVSEHRLKFLRRNAYIRTTAQPRLYLSTQTTLLQLVDDALQTAQVGPRQCCRNDHGRFGSRKAPHRSN